MTSSRLQKAKFGVLLIVVEVIFIVIYGLAVDYEDSAKPPASLMNMHGKKHSTHVPQDHHHSALTAAAKNYSVGDEAEAASGSTGQGQGHEGHVDEGHAEAEGVAFAPEPGPLAKFYPMFQDVHVMIFVGFGFLVTYLRRYMFSGVGLNMVVGAVMIQWAVIVAGLMHSHGGKVHLGITSMLTAEFATAAVLITVCALLGKTSPIQLVVIGLLEMVVFAVNEWIGLSKLQVVDVGGSMFVHAFGAYFGLAASRVLYKEDVPHSQKEGSDYRSDISAMIGTVFLWLFWPSFNSALAVEDAQHRAVINTYLALAACCVVTFALSSLTDPRGKFDMVHIQNATLAGGVAVGTTADMMIGTWGALLIGSLAGALCVVGYRYVTPFLASRLKIHDTCGVHNLHGMPAILAAIAGAVGCVIADFDTYGYTLYRQFPARAPSEANSSELQAIRQYLHVEAGLGRSGAQQAGYQMAALGLTLVLALVGGLVAGVVARFVPLNQPAGELLFEDQDNWDVPEEHPHTPRDSTAAPLMATSPRNGDMETAFSRD